MNKHFLFACLALLFFQLHGQAQHAEQASLQLSLQKTSSLVFPHAIKSVDRGSPDVLAQVPRESQHVLHVKAARQGFPETNLTVLTADGKLYAFTVTYAAQPALTLLRLEDTPPSTPVVPLTGTALNAAQLQSICRELAGDTPFYNGIKDREGNVKAAVTGIYTYGNTVFYRVVLANRSPLSYELDFLRLSVRDRKQARRTASQEEEVQPRYVHGLDRATVAPGGEKVIVLVLEKTNMTRRKALSLELFERQGGRHLRLLVKHRHLLQAPPLVWGDLPGHSIH